MSRLLLVSLTLAALAVAPALADPGITTTYHDGLLRVTLDGSYGGAYYQVWRSEERAGDYRPLTSEYALCTGDCFLTDARVAPGATVYYRFDLELPGGRFVSYGPYAVTVPDTPLGTRVSPNPSNSAVRVDLSLPGSPRGDAPLHADARVLDLQGRTVRVLHSGALGRGVSTVVWDGRGDDGRALGAGIYFVRLTTRLGVSTARIIRFH
jgi:hypothetical protein